MYTDTGCKLSDMTAPANPVQFSLFAFLSVLGSAVNLATAWALLRDARLRGRATSCFLVNLSLADLAFSLFNGPLDSAVFYYGDWTHGQRLCVAAALVRHVAVGSSLASIQLITLNRYTSVVKPRSYARIFSPGSCLLLAAVCWVLPAGLLLPAALGVPGASLGWDKRLQSCTVLPSPVYRPVIYLGSALLPLLLFAACYPRLFLALRHSRRRLTSHIGTLQSIAMQPSTSAPDLSREPMQPARSNSICAGRGRERQLLGVLGAILCSFCICYLPLLISVGLNQTPPLLVHGLFYAAPCINPLVYVAMSRDYRRAYAALFCCGGGDGGNSNEG